MQERPLPPIPVDTEINARSAFNPNHFYIRFGDQTQSFLDGIDFASVNFPINSVGLPASLFALISIFQFREQLSDFQISEAIRTRLDMKYALHLPVVCSQVKPAALCRGRSHLLANKQGQRVVDELIDRLAENDYLNCKDEEALDACSILQSICTIQRLYDISQKTVAAMVEIATSHTDWLRDTMLPHWIIRYGSKRIAIPDRNTDQAIFAHSFGLDILYLLDQVDASNNKGLQELPEIHALRAACLQNYQPENAPGESFRWRTASCARCPAE